MKTLKRNLQAITMLAVLWVVYRWHRLLGRETLANNLWDDGIDCIIEVTDPELVSK